MTVHHTGCGRAGFRLSPRPLVAAILAVLGTEILWLPGLVIVQLYSTMAHGILSRFVLSDSVLGIANIVFLLMLPNIVVAFFCGFAALRLANLAIRPADWRIAACIAAGIEIVYALVSIFVFPHAVHVLVGTQLPGTVLGYLALGRRRGTGKSWRTTELVLASLVLVAVLANMLLPRFMLHQYFQAATGRILEPMKPDPRLPTFHRVQSELPQN